MPTTNVQSDTRAGTYIRITKSMKISSPSWSTSQGFPTPKLAMPDRLTAQLIFYIRKALTLCGFSSHSFSNDFPDMSIVEYALGGAR